MKIICSECGKVAYIQDPDGYEDMDIIELFKIWHSYNLCSECEKKVLRKILEFKP